MVSKKALQVKEKRPGVEEVRMFPTVQIRNRPASAGDIPSRRMISVSSGRTILISTGVWGAALL